MFSLINRGTLQSSVLSEFENLTTRLKGLWLGEHNEDGTHSNITASSLTLQGASVGEMISPNFQTLTFTTPDLGVWTVSSSNLSYLRYSQVGQLVFVNFEITDSTLTTDTTDSFDIIIPNIHAKSTQIKADLTGFSQVSACGEWHCLDSTAVFREGLLTASVFPSLSATDSVPFTKISLNCWEDGLGFHQFPKGTYSNITGSLWFFIDKPSEVTVKTF